MKNITNTPTGRNGLNVHPSSHEDQHYRHDPRNIKGDEKLPKHEDLVAKSRARQAAGSTGKGLNDQSHLDSMDDFNHAPEVRKTVLTSQKTAQKEAKTPLNKGGR
jgi:hypothetical protein